MSASRGFLLASSNAKLIDVLPDGGEFVSASNGGTYKAATRTVTWNVGTVNVVTPAPGPLSSGSAPAGTVLTNSATITAPGTTSVSVPAVTTLTQRGAPA